jgi:type IV pilus assembly protein PilB
MTTPRLRLGQLLVDAKLITDQALQEVLVRQRADGRRLGTLLVEGGYINETQLTQILSHQLSVPWVSLLHIEFSRQLLNLVPHDVADRFCLVPIYVRHVRNQGDTLYVAMDDPSNEDGLHACRDHAGLPVRAMIAPPHDIRNAIRVYYGSSGHTPATASVSSNESVTAPAPPLVEEAAVAAAPPDAAAIEAPVEAPSAASVEVPVEAPAADSIPAAVEAPSNAELEEPAPASLRKAAAFEARIDAMLSAETAESRARADNDGPEIETTEILLGDPASRAGADRLRAIVDATSTAPASERGVERIPLPRGRTPRMVALTLLDGTTIPLPAKRRPRPEAEADVEAPRTQPVRSEPPVSEAAHGLTARDLVVALRAVAQGADGSEVLGSNERWEAMFAALLSLMLKKHLIADWEFVEELEKMK